MSPGQCLPYYQGKVAWIQVLAESGKKIRFPARLIRPYVTCEGISGVFEIEFTASGKLSRMTKIS